jgi:hypothetical protein
MIKKTFKKFEQIIWVYSLLIYMTAFTIIFNDELKTGEGWIGFLWLIQFFGFGTLLGLYSRKRGWTWPQR